ncbi:MAG: magnesium transporter [Candidatus Riflebacteria bacterium]|nr:magnesium transporter [Candidatus Riflebacteria bacterium]
MKKKYNVQEIQAIQAKINALDPVDLAEKLVGLSEADLTLSITLLDRDLLADAFALLPAKKKIQIVQSLTDEKLMTLVKELDEDELADTLQELPADLFKKLMEDFIDDERKPIVKQLLGYSDETVGSIMSVNFLTLQANVMARDAIDAVLASELDADRLEQIWLSDESQALTGYVYLADLLRNKDSKLENFLNPIAATVQAGDDQETVAKLAYKYDLPEIPVVDAENKLIGLVPVEWAIDIMHEEHEEDLANIRGIGESTPESYMEKSSFQMAKDRTNWLIICLVTATLTGLIIQKYEAVLATSVILTAFIPMLMDSGGNAGTQSSTTVITSMYSGEIHFKDTLKVLFKEFKVGLIAGLALVLVNMLKMYFFDKVTWGVGMTVSITLLLTVVLSKVIGALLPLVAEKINVDPTIMAGPLITTIVDTFVLLVYFEVASLLLGI